MFIRKFYDTAEVDTGGGTEVAELSPAALMAKHGSKSDENSVAAPIDITEKKEEIKPEEPEVAATATPSSNEKPSSETPQETKSQVEETKKEEPPIAAEPQKVQTLDEVLKNNQPDTIFKALGFDDQKAEFVSKIKDIDPKVVGILQAYEKGTLGDYIKELSVDYSKMEPEDLMRHQLRLDYPKATERQLEILYKKEIIDAYNLDSEDEDEAADGKELLAAKADKYRDTFIANQEKYLMPEKPEPKAEAVPDNTAEQKAKENVEAHKRELIESPIGKDIFANKKITLGEGESRFSFEVDPESLVATVTDANEWVKAMYDKVETGADGKEYNVLNTEKQMLVAAIQKYGTKFLEAYALHHAGLGGKKVIEPIENASKPDNSTPAKSDPLPTSAAALMAKQGTRRSGG